MKKKTEVAVKTAVIAFVHEDSILGQSIGCVVPLRREIRVGKFVRLCARITNGRPHGSVSINIISSHSDIAGSCISIAFHLTPTLHPLSTELLVQRGHKIRNWIRDEFNIQEFFEKKFSSRIEFSKYLQDPLIV